MIQKLKQTLGLCRIERSTDAALSDLQTLKRELKSISELLSTPEPVVLTSEVSEPKERPAVRNIPAHVAETAQWLMDAKGYSLGETCEALSVSNCWLHNKGVRKNKAVA